jgi:molecular chaperone HtpG
MEQIKFKLEISRVLNLLVNDIYDSPYAFLRENVQNAYDAILMRMQKDSEFQPKIEITLNGKQIDISDNGIGMSRDVVENNFWKAGSSGKNNEEARKAGVVGTFGIGAMANFGICNYLKIKTHFLGSDTTIISDVNKSDLSLDNNCISIEMNQEDKESGTIVSATLENHVVLNLNDGKNYLLPYIKYLKFPVLFNGELISQQEYFDPNRYLRNNIVSIENDYNFSGYRFHSNIYITNTGKIDIYITHLSYNQQCIAGDVFLEQDAQVIFGTRNRFGLATIPVNTIFNFGGIVNLSILTPTAGREAISRESIQFVTNLVQYIEKIAAQELAKYEICDINKAFLNYIYQTQQYQLADKIKIQALPSKIDLCLGTVQKEMNGKKVYYYSGDDKQIINQYANENNILFHLSHDTARRNIQQYILRKKMIEQISNNPQIIKEFDEDDLSAAEFSLYLRLTSILKEDYLISNPKIVFAEISHQVPNLIDKKNEIVYVYLSRSSNNVMQLLTIREQTPELFEPFVKDYIRNYLYQKLSPLVPSSTREGADALLKLLQKKKELFTIELEDLGKIETLLKDYNDGKISINEVFKSSVSMVRPQTQTLEQNQIGSIEQELSTIIDNSLVTSAEEKIVKDVNFPFPAIKILSNETNKKVLRTNSNYDQLNRFTMFLGLSDKLYERECDFFFDPHFTKIIWGMHRIIYIFIHASRNITLYYDIELQEHLNNNQAGGCSIPTTTIISKNRIFVPVLNELIPCFEVKDKPLSFHVRYDLIVGSEATN